MSEEKKNVETEEVKEAHKLTEEELEQVTGGVLAHVLHDGAPGIVHL